MTPQRRYAYMGILGTLLFCLGVGLIVRRCEMRQLGIGTIATFAELREIRSAIQRSHAHAVPDRR